MIARAYNHASLASHEALLPGRQPPGVDELLQALWTEQDDNPGHVLLVSHQPLVSRLVDHYLGTPGLAPGLVPGGQATLALDAPAAGCGRLLFLAQPPEYGVWS